MESKDQMLTPLTDKLAEIKTKEFNEIFRDDEKDNV